jgi:O-antigen ligase
MKVEMKYIQLLSIYLGLVAFGVVVLPKMTGLFLLGLIIIVVYGFIKKELIFQLNKLGSLFILMYLAFLIGTIFTHNTPLALRYVENKLSYVLFPLLFSFKPKEELKLNWSFIGFVSGTLLITLIGLFQGIYCYLGPTGSSVCVFASSVSPFIHPTYLSVYLMISIGIVLKGWKEKWQYYNPKWIIPFLVFAILMHGLLLSLSGILFLFIVIGFYCLYRLKKSVNKLIFYASVLVLPLIGYFSITNIPQIEGEWYNAKWYADEYLKSPDAFVKSRVYPMSGTEVRIVMWTAAVKAIQKHPLGVGTGNVDEYLAKELNLLNQKELAKEELNPHNQFFQTTLEIGVFGILILLSIIGYGFYTAFKENDYLLMLIVGSLFFNSLFESMLQRHSGIVIYTFWICLLSILYLNKEKDQKIG